MIELLFSAKAEDDLFLLMIDTYNETMGAQDTDFRKLILSLYSMAEQLYSNFVVSNRRAILQLGRNIN